jgi:hypothetical protein
VGLSVQKVFEGILGTYVLIVAFFPFASAYCCFGRRTKGETSALGIRAIEVYFVRTTQVFLLP